MTRADRRFEQLIAVVILIAFLVGFTLGGAAGIAIMDWKTVVHVEHS